MPSASGRAGSHAGERIPPPSRDELLRVFHLKYGDIARLGPTPRRHLRFGYFTPDDYYEALVARHVTPGCRWLDVGGGRDVFPFNADLSRQLADRAGHLTAVDPDHNVHSNPYARERIKTTIEEYAATEPFDLLTCRMVAEHIEQPDRAVAAMVRLLRPHAHLILYTVNWWSAVSMASRLVPFPLHHRIKAVAWGSEERDTFPVAYRMNTRSELTRLMLAHGLVEAHFAYLDDCRTFHRATPLHWLELATWRTLATVGVHYPETCLLGVYRRA